MKKITAFLAALKLAIIDRFTTDTAELIAKLAKLEAKIEQAIAKDEKKLAQLDDMARSIAAAKDLKNTQVDRAYKLLHNVTSFTA